MFEKRKNSQKRTGLSIAFAIAFVMAGIFVGMSINEEPEPDIIVEEARITTVDLSGEWIGTTTEDYAAEPRYDYRIVIEQDNNNNISGMGYLDMIEDEEIYAAERIEGYVDGDTVIYSEVETLVLDNLSLDEWCLTETTLTYQIINDQETLVGTWEYVLDDERCQGISGRVILTRQPE